jgi:hypothetical protein
MHLFENYPINFRKYMKANKLTHWDMVKHIRYLSFWYDNLANDITPRYIPFGNIITYEEIKNGKKYLISKGELINKKNLSKLFSNYNFFSHMKE